MKNVHPDLQTETKTLLRQSKHYDPSLALKWLKYLHVKDQLKLSQDQKDRLSFCQMFEDLSHDDRNLFHLTVTYKPYKGATYLPKNVDDFFKNFYLKCFLPHLMGTRNYNKEKYRPFQPICYAFLDEHHKRRPSSNGQMVNPDRLHHHAIVAVTSDNLIKMRSLCGDNKTPLRINWAGKVMTHHIVECESKRVLYASKMHEKYPHFLMFPDRWSD